MNLPLASTLVPLIGAVVAGLLVGWVLPDPWHARRRKGYIVSASSGGDEPEEESLQERLEAAERESEMLQAQLHALRSAREAEKERGAGDGDEALDEMQEQLEDAKYEREEALKQVEELQLRARQQQKKLDDAADRLVELERERMRKGEGMGLRPTRPQEHKNDDSNEDGETRPAKWVEPLISARETLASVSREHSRPTQPESEPVAVATLDPDTIDLPTETEDDITTDIDTTAQLEIDAASVDLELERDDIEADGGFASPLATPSDDIGFDIQRSEPLAVSTTLDDDELLMDPREEGRTSDRVDSVVTGVSPEELTIDDELEDTLETELETEEVEESKVPAVEFETEAEIEIDVPMDDPVEAPTDEAPADIPEIVFESGDEAEAADAAEPEASNEEESEDRPEPGAEMGACHPLKSIDGMGPDVIERLALIEVKTTHDLVRKCAKRSGINGLAQGMSFKTSEVEKWVSAADLLRIERMRQEDVSYLLAKGVNGIAAMAEADPEGLAARLATTGQTKVAGVEVVEQWVSRARALKPVLRW